MHDDAFREALSRYNQDMPRVIVEDVTGDGSTYDLTLTSWVDRFSSVRSVEYPAGYRPATFVDPNEYEVYHTSNSAHLRLQLVTPGSGETVRVTYTGLHTLSGLDSAATTTVYAWHEDALVCLASSRLMMRLADLYLHEQGGSLLQADAIDRQSEIRCGATTRERAGVGLSQAAQRRVRRERGGRRHRLGHQFRGVRHGTTYSPEPVALMADLEITYNDHGLAALYKEAPEMINQELHTATEVAAHFVEGKVVQFSPRGAGPIHLYQTITSEVRGTGVNVIGEIYSTDIPVKVASVEEGRAPGKMPPWGPGSSLALWVERKAGGDSSAAFLIARAIGRRGTQGAHMFQKAFDASRGEVETMLERVAEDLVRRLSS